jgi:RNA polymerase primary sigma factor
MWMGQLKVTKSITTRDSASLELFLRNIGKYSLLDQDEEAALARKSTQWDMIARNKLVEHNLRFVVSVAKKYLHQWLSLNELINEWSIGLAKAAERFDESKWFKFISYAVWRIRQSILAALAESSRIVRLPLNKVWFTNKVTKTTIALQQTLEREPTSEEIAEVMEMSIEDIDAAMAYDKKRYISLDAPIKEDSESSLGELFEQTTETQPGTTLIAEDCKSDIMLVFKTLPDKQSKVLMLYYGLWDTKDSYCVWNLEAIGNKMDLTRERVRQIKDKAISNIQNVSPKRELLRKYL